MERDEEHFDIRALQSPFPVISPSEVEIPSDDPDTALDTIPQELVVEGQALFYNHPSRMRSR